MIKNCAFLNEGRHFKANWGQKEWGGGRNLQPVIGKAETELHKSYI
jgi:hypothetical protein